MHVFSAPWELVVLSCIPQESNHFWNWPESALWLREHINTHIQFPLLLSFEIFYESRLQQVIRLCSKFCLLSPELSSLIKFPFFTFHILLCTRNHLLPSFSALFTSCSWKQEYRGIKQREEESVLQLGGSQCSFMFLCWLDLMHQTWLIMSHPKYVYVFFICLVIRMKIFTKEWMIADLIALMYSALLSSGLFIAWYVSIILISWFMSSSS